MRVGSLPTARALIECSILVAYRLEVMKRRTRLSNQSQRANPRPRATNPAHFPNSPTNWGPSISCGIILQKQVSLVSACLRPQFLGI